MVRRVVRGWSGGRLESTWLGAGLVFVGGWSVRGEVVRVGMVRVRGGLAGWKAWAGKMLAVGKVPLGVGMVRAVRGRGARFRYQSGRGDRCSPRVVFRVDGWERRGR